MVPSLSALFGIVDVLKTTVSSATKSIIAQLGSVVGEQTEGDRAEWWQHSGFISRPPKAVPGKQACQAVTIRRGDHDIVIASRDLRGQDLAASLDDGETCIYAAGPDGTAQGRILLKKDGTVALYTAEGNAGGGSSCVIQLTGDGNVHLATQHGALVIGNDGSIKMMAKAGAGAGVQLNASGVALLGQSVAVNGGSVGLGAAPTLAVMYGDFLQPALLSFGAAIAAAFAAPPGTLVTGAPAVVTACTALAGALTFCNSTSVKTSA